VTGPLEEAYRAHADELVRYATTFVGPDRAADVVTDAFLAVYDGHSRDVEHTRAYLYRAVFHRSVDVRRSRDRRRRREDRVERERLRAATSPAIEVSVDARRALDTLSDQQRAVVFLTYWADHPPSVVADLLGVSEGTVRKQLARARRRLREVLDV